MLPQAIQVAPRAKLRGWSLCSTLWLRLIKWGLNQQKVSRGGGGVAVCTNTMGELGTGRKIYRQFQLNFVFHPRDLSGRAVLWNSTLDVFQAKNSTKAPFNIYTIVMDTMHIMQFANNLGYICIEMKTLSVACFISIGMGKRDNDRHSAEFGLHFSMQNQRGAALKWFQPKGE